MFVGSLQFVCSFLIKHSSSHVGRWLLPVLLLTSPRQLDHVDGVHVQRVVGVVVLVSVELGADIGRHENSVAEASGSCQQVEEETAGVERPAQVRPSRVAPGVTR